MLTIHAVAISKDLRLPPYAASGTILSIHQDYLNIFLNTGVLTLVRKGKPLMPFGIEVDISDNWSFLSIGHKQRVCVTDSQVLVDDCLTVRGIKTCAQHSCAPREGQMFDNTEIRRRLLHLQEICRLSPGSDGIQTYLGRYRLDKGRLLQQNQEGVVEQRLKMRFEALVTGVLREDEFLIAEGVHGLLGVGPGLTPSGDDFLVGFLAGLMYSRRENCRVSIHAMARCLTQDAALFTTSLSAEYVKFAAKGLYHQYFTRLINAFQADSWEALASSAQQLINLGHYSGTDLLLGFAYGGMTALHAGEKGCFYEDF